MNIFILCAGKGSRFESIYPKPLNLVNGKPMIFHTINSLKLEQIKSYNLYIIYNRKLDACNFKEILINMFPKIKFNFILIDYFTRGASESAFVGLQMVYKELNDSNIIFLDNDTIYPEETYQYLDQHYDYNFIFTNFNTEKDPIYSYIKINEDNQILSIKEKEKISDLICVGGYGFLNKDMFINTFKSILEANEKTNNEFYMSLMYEFIMNSKNILIKNITIDKIISMGTPNQLVTSRIKTKLRYVFDLDNTLVTYPTINGDYTSVKPIPKMINLLKKLKEEGHTIIIYTARRMGTHHHNIGAVVKDIGRITFDTLDKFEIPYDELIFGKPLGDIYIDDRAYNPYDERIFKLIGEYQLINDDIENKIQNNKYNEIKCIDEKIIKTVPIETGSGELFFYENLHQIPLLKDYFVKYYGYKLNINQIELKLEKINGIPISYLYMNKTYSLKLFDELLNNINMFHEIKLNNQLDLDEYKSNYILKIKKRFENKQIYNFENADYLYEKIITRLNTYLNSKNFEDNIVSVIHGDMWFSNILLTYKDEYKFIDMKGIIHKTKSISGDRLYDYAKILQSLVGFDAILYDKEIDAAYNLIFVNHYKKWLQQQDVSPRDVKTVCALLMFGVFHAYENMAEEKKLKIVKMIEILLGENKN